MPHIVRPIAVVVSATAFWLSAGLGLASKLDPDVKRIGQVNSRGLQRSADGLAAAWLEPTPGVRPRSSLAEYRCDLASVRRIHDVVAFAYAPTGEMGIVRGGSADDRVLELLPPTGSTSARIGLVDEFWLGPGGVVAAQRKGEISLWTRALGMRPTALRAPVEVSVPESLGRVRMVLREIPGGRVTAVGGSGELRELATTTSAIAVDRRGNTIAAVGCERPDQVCIWRAGGRARVYRVPGATRLGFDAEGRDLAILAENDPERALVIALENGKIKRLDTRVAESHWARNAPLLVWTRLGPGGMQTDASGWSPSTGLLEYPCGRGSQLKSLAPSPDGASIACLESQGDGISGRLSFGPASGKGAFEVVSDSAVSFGFSPAGDVLWMRHNCARDQRDCALATVAISAGAAAGRLTRLSGIGSRIRFDESRSDRILFDFDGRITLRENGSNKRLGPGVGWDGVALLANGALAFVAEGPDGGVFLVGPPVRK